MSLEQGSLHTAGSPTGPSSDGTPPSSFPTSGLSKSGQIFEDAAIEALYSRAADYIAAGVALNLSGPAGLGKTTLALRLAEARGRPVAFMTGNEWLDRSDLVGRTIGQSSRTVVDKYIQSVRRTDAEVRNDWKDSILSVAMQRGYTLVYDEFTRATPEANAMLLSVLEEGVLVTTDRSAGRSYVMAHPEFRIILTANPHDYVAVNTTPDALLDRMVTLTMPEPTAQTLSGIVALRTGLSAKTADQVVALVLSASDALSAKGSRMRAALHIGRIAAHKEKAEALSETDIAQIADDVLRGRSASAATARPGGAIPPPGQTSNMRRIAG